jgi:hypothetical protein
MSDWKEKSTDALEILVTQYLEEFIEWMKKGSDWTASQAGLLAQEIVLFELWSSVFLAAFGIVLIPVGFLLFKWGREVYRTSHDEFIAAMIMIFSTILMLGGSITFVCQSYDSIKAATAPRLVIIEKVADLLKPNPRQ